MKTKKYAEGGQVMDDQEKGWMDLPESVRSEGAGPEETDPADIPEHIREMIEATHDHRQDSRPDENWRIKPADKGSAIAPYKKDIEDEKKAELPEYFDGVQVPDSNQLLQDIAPSGVGMLTPSPSAPPVAPALAEAPSAPWPASMAPKSAAPPAPALTDQDFMDRANKMLGLNPDQQAGFMKLLGDKAQKAQLGSAVAGIGDAIASGGTLGKVNPGALNKSEELINGRTSEGLEGLKSIRDSQGKAMEVADKLESRDPQSPLSKWAQKAYGSVGKKIGIDLSNASASLIGDVTGKGVDALNTQYQNELKQMGLKLQEKQVEATIGNQKAERDIAREGHQADAAKTLADRGILKTIAGAIPGTAGHNATKILENEAQGVRTFNSVQEAEGAGLPHGTRVSIGGRMATIK